MNSKIKFIFLDLGGVLFHWRELFQFSAKRYSKTPDEIEKVFLRYDALSLTGEISIKEFWSSVLRDLEVVSDDTFFDIILGSFLPIQQMHTFVKELISILPVGLLTNIHQGLLEFYLQRHFIPSLNFSPIIQSCYIGLKKPDEKIFLYATKQANLLPHEILFIDDEINNIIAAKKIGWSAIQFREDTPEQSIHEIKDFLSADD